MPPESPMPIPGTSWTIPPSHTLLPAPNLMSRVEEFRPDALVWDPHLWKILSTIARPEKEHEERLAKPLHADTADFG